MRKVGLIGLGVMDLPMAASLVKGGHQMFAHHRKALPAQLAGQGVARQADIIMLLPVTAHVAPVL
ncbi:NAD(P)-binding domain-containing protein [Massilia sp. S19_KUP03_FR1]|uniref:NAD(P)-binding domain-containing protein n=1 Tax=Massilia sp. S19_KUP03_FR1 TaxID=3025503 RepID=UPI002FCDD87B